MLLEIKKTIDIDIENIINCFKITKNSTREEIEAYVEDEVAILDDCDYYLIGEQEIKTITNFIIDKLNNNNISNLEQHLEGGHSDDNDWLEYITE